MPSGKNPRVGRSAPSACGNKPFTISYEVPSPPTAMKLRTPRPYASRAICVASPDAWVSATLTSRPPACRRSRAGPSSLRVRPPPAAGFTIARYVCPKILDRRIQQRNAQREFARHNWSQLSATSPRLLPAPPTCRFLHASTCRLIFMEAVRGKSFSQIKYPPTRLKSGRRRLRAEISSSNLSSNF